MKNELRPLNVIAFEIERECSGKSWYAPAEAYVTPLQSLTSITDHYFADDGKSIVAYAISNLTSWRGETAKAVKAELKLHLAS